MKLPRSTLVRVACILSNRGFDAHQVLIPTAIHLDMEVCLRRAHTNHGGCCALPRLFYRCFPGVSRHSKGASCTYPRAGSSKNALAAEGMGEGASSRTCCATSRWLRTPRLIPKIHAWRIRFSLSLEKCALSTAPTGRDRWGNTCQRDERFTDSKGK